MEKEDRLARNIKTLRRYYNETQFELAQMIGIEANGGTTISNYENGKRRPTSENQKRIAEHFRITEDQLLYGEFDYLENRSWVNGFKVSTDLAETFFPIVATKKAIEDDNEFAEGYRLQKELRKEIIAGRELDYEKYDAILRFYKKSKEENEILARANVMSGLFLFALAMGYIQNLEMFEDAIINRWSNNEWRDYVVLQNFEESFQDSAENKKEMEELKHDFLKEYGDYLWEGIKLLRESSDWYELAELYCAEMYLCLLVDDGKTNNENRMIGYEMLALFYQLGNRYVKRIYKNYY